jgi:hypothetical protein
MEKPKRYSKNVPGDFYVEDGCCTACGIPEYHAPELTTYDAPDLHCYFSKQPENNSELYNAIKAVFASEVQCLRYAGEDEGILRRLAEADVRETCDRQELVPDVAPIVRNHVTFSGAHILSAYELADAFRDHLKNTSGWNKHLNLSGIEPDGHAVTFTYTWYDRERYPISFKAVGNEWHVFHARKGESAASRGISVSIDAWLRTSRQFNDIKWFAESDWVGAQKDWTETAI